MIFIVKCCDFENVFIFCIVKGEFRIIGKVVFWGLFLSFC